MVDESVTVTETESSYDFDGIWKEFIREYWPEILRDVIPDLYDAVDFEQKAEFLDKEMQEISQQLYGDNDSVSKWYVDNLIKIWLKDGREEWVLLHIEIQGKGGEIISLRMFRYSCLIFLRYGKHPAALAILTSKRPKKEGNPEAYCYDIFGTTLEYKYHTLKTYEYRNEELLASDSPVHIFIYAVKMAVRHRKSGDKKLEYMLKVARLLKARGWSKERMRVFFKYLEFLMINSGREYRYTFIEKSIEILEGKKVKLMTFEEEVREKAMAEGLAKGLAEGLAKGLAEAHAEFTRSLIGSGLLTNEQIATITKQTPEYVASLKQEITV